MRQQQHEFFASLLSNEQAFDRLFCDVRESTYSTFFFNSAFSDDPVFNHFSFKPSLLAEEGDASDRFEAAIAAAQSALCESGVSYAGFFVESFWPLADSFERACVEKDFRVGGGMEILSKKLKGPDGKRQLLDKPRGADSSVVVVVSSVSELENWNEVFVRSFGIPSSWQPELRRLTGDALAQDRATFLLCLRGGAPAGCLLLVKNPPKVMGVYCVGTVPEARGEGVAKTLLSASERITAEDDCDFMTLQTIVEDGVSPMYRGLDYQVDFTRTILRAP